jgi:kanamycin kinase
LPLSEVPAGWTAEPIRSGKSGATVERWTRPGARDRYAFERDAAGRMERLVTTAVAGIDAATLAGYDHEADERDTGVSSDEAAALARRFGAALRELHDALDPQACPFDGRLDGRLAAAARRVAEGDVDDDDFEPENDGRTPAELLDRLLRTRPDGEDLVVAHGDWCYPNVLFDGGDRWGMIDLAGLGVSCRWNDLGIGARSTSHNLGDEAVPAFFAGYGVEPDRERVDYYVLLDELQ